MAKPRFIVQVTPSTATSTEPVRVTDRMGVHSPFVRDSREEALEEIARIEKRDAEFPMRASKA